LLALYEDHDALIGLSHIVPPEPIRETRSNLSRPEDFNKKVAHARRMLSYPFNIANVPAMNVPCGFSDGLPMGFQVSAKPYDEATLYRVAHAYEQEVGWYRTHPDLEQTLSGASEEPDPQDPASGEVGEVRPDIQKLGKLVGLDIPDEDSSEVGLRFDAVIKAIGDIEAALGDEMDKVDPIPPVYPHR
ncbi:MAG TPA: hypothetical protein DCE33_05680, partial [Rhodospirillaceae bacterium]|nr:hypothetical protein [Rhodospirillaceae bacterium]